MHELVDALGGQYHVSCFVCSGCHSRFPDGIIALSLSLSPSPSPLSFSMSPIKSKFINWILTTDLFLGVYVESKLTKGQVYCQPCFYRSEGKKCNACGEPITETAYQKEEGEEGEGGGGEEEK